VSAKDPPAEENKTNEVIRGIPSWLQDLEKTASAIGKRTAARRESKEEESEENNP
jgi:hypothetical protein